MLFAQHLYIGTCARPVLAALAAMLLGACYTPLDELPAQTTATAYWFQEETADFGFAELLLESDVCTVLDPDETRFTLNGMPPTTVNFGGRGREPTDAFNGTCASPRASWERSGQLSDPLVFRLEDEDNSLDFIVGIEGTILVCDFPDCNALDLETERPPPVR